MKGVSALATVAALLGQTAAAISGENSVAKSAAPRTFGAYDRLPCRFEPNVGQMPSDARFLSRGRGYTTLLSPMEAVLHLKGGETCRLKLVGANPEARSKGLDELPGKVN